MMMSGECENCQQTFIRNRTINGGLQLCTTGSFGFKLSLIKWNISKIVGHACHSHLPL